MKKSLLLFAAIILSGLGGIAQNYNLVIFSEDGDPFYAIVNGIRQNDKPETNVRITGLNSEALSIRVEFKDPALPKLKQSMMGEGGFEHTIRIKKSVKKELKLQYFGKVELAEAPKSGASTVAYHTSENTISENAEPTHNSTGSNDNNHTTVTTTSTSTQVNSNPDNVSLNINMGGAGINMNISGMDGNMNGVESTSSTTVTTKTTSSSSGVVSNNNQSASAKTTTKTQPVAPVTKGGCSVAMTTTSFDQMKKSIADKPFSDTKMSTAKIATKNNCVSVSQVKQICALFSMDEEKLEYAKYAYDFCVDKGNYYQVSEAFSFSGTTDDFNKFLEGH